jgi:uncharacterized membrane protein
MPAPTTPDVLTLSFAAVGVAMMLAAIPLLRRRVGPNPFYGLRVRETLADERVWFEANAATGRDLLVVGAGQLVLALLLPWIPGFPRGSIILVQGVLLLVAVLGVCLRGWDLAERLAAQRREGSH